MRAMFGTDDLPGLAPGLTIVDETGWSPATKLVDGSRLPELLDAARLRWNAAPHAAAALAWKAYTYWLALPAVLGWASARRVPLLRPADVLIHFDDDRPLLTIGLRRTIEVAVLPTDPLALAAPSGIRVVADEGELLAALRGSLLDEHLTPMLDSIHARVRLGTRTLLGSVASGVAHGILRAADALPGSSARNIDTLLDALDVGDLVDLVPGPTGQLTVQRRTCCLAFTLPKPKICAGCCIRPAS
nr:IucA/IucC family C-terminal-domain containing protein [Micromonospora sp. DSM 115978]